MTLSDKALIGDEAVGTFMIKSTVFIVPAETETWAEDVGSGILVETKLGITVILTAKLEAVRDLEDELLVLFHLVRGELLVGVGAVEQIRRWRRKFRFKKCDRVTAMGDVGKAEDDVFNNG